MFHLILFANIDAAQARAFQFQGIILTLPLKLTAPFNEASTWIFPIGPSSVLYVAMITLTLSTILWKVWYRSSCSNCNSNKARSILFMKRTGLILSAMAWRNTVSVCTHTPGEERYQSINQSINHFISHYSEMIQIQKHAYRFKWKDMHKLYIERKCTEAK